jgi:4-hydroxy-4-methyl-2-oxoglutarate aldolase
MSLAAAGRVVDGYVRDSALLKRDGFPVYCRGTQPIDAYGRWQIVDYQVDVFLHGTDGLVRVRPNDYIFADSDGVIVIPGELGDEVCRLATERMARENRIRENLSGYEDIQRLHDELGRW